MDQVPHFLEFTMQRRKCRRIDGKFITAGADEAQSGFHIYSRESLLGMTGWAFKRKLDTEIIITGDMNFNVVFHVHGPQLKRRV